MLQSRDTTSCLRCTHENRPKIESCGKLGKNFEVTFGIFSVSVSQINVLESYLDISLF